MLRKEELQNAPDTTPNWQQYCLFGQPGDSELYAIIDNWSGTVPDGTYAQIINYEANVAALPKASYIPAGASINIAPSFGSDNVLTGVTYVYTPPKGQALTSSITLEDLQVYNSNQQITAAYESPIAALTLNIVGDYNGNDGAFTSGSGTITYTADQPLTVLTTEPSYTAFQDGTGETANTVYGELPKSNSRKIVQTWGISPKGKARVQPQGVGHKLPIPPSAKFNKRGNGAVVEMAKL